jgi:hypothetical protein
MPTGRVVWLSRGFVPGTVHDNPIYASDDQYMAQLYARPERERRWLIMGDWDAAGGLYFDELSESAHFVRPFDIPLSWQLVAGYDWGYAHPFALCWGAFDPDGTLWVGDTISGHRLKDHQQAERINRLAPHLAELKITIMGGGDALNEHHARIDGTIPSTAERLREAGLRVVRANDRDRTLTYTNLRDYHAYRSRGEDGQDVKPRLRFMDTPGNRRLWEEMSALSEDKDDPESPVKRNANPDTGEGGDDRVDALKNMCAIRMRRGATKAAREREVDVFAPATLAWMHQQSQRVRQHADRRSDRGMTYNEIGG